MPQRTVVLSLFVLVITLRAALADPPQLAFTRAGEGLFEFDTGKLEGRLKLDGKYQGVYPLIDVATGTQLVNPPEDCFAVSSPWNPLTPQAKGYRSLYLSLFGCDLQAGQTASARCRLVIGRELTDEQAVRLYGEYLESE